MNPRVMVIGHPLAAPENRAPFHSSRVDYHLCVPETWRAGSLGRTYQREAGCPPGANLYFEPVIFGGRNSWYLWRRLSRLINRLNPDAVYCWGEPWCLSTRQVLKTVSKKTPCLFYSAENRPKRLPFLFRQVQEFVYGHAAGSVGVTPEVMDRMKASGFSKPLHEIPLWIDREFAAHFTTPSMDLAYVGRLIPLKNVSLIIQALPALEKFSLQIFGDGPQREALKNLATRLGVAHRVVFHGALPHHLLAHHLKDCSMVLLPTGENPRQAEQFGKAALEAIALGLPVVVSQSGHYRTLPQITNTARSLESLSPRDIASAVQDVHRHYPSLERRKKASEKVLSRYGVPAAQKSFESLFLNE